MTQKLLLDDIRDRVRQIAADWTEAADDERTHSQVHQLMVEVIYTIASAPQATSLKNHHQEMARAVYELNTVLDFERWTV